MFVAVIFAVSAGCFCEVSKLSYFVRPFCGGIVHIAVCVDKVADISYMIGLV